MESCDTMCANPVDAAELCGSCVYYPPNLPRFAYSADDWATLQSQECSFEYRPGSEDCLATRKTSCSLVDLAAVKRS